MKTNYRKENHFTNRVETYLEIRIDIFGNDILGLWFVLTINDIHLESTVTPFEQISQLDWIFDAFLEVFAEGTRKNKNGG